MAYCSGSINYFYYLWISFGRTKSLLCIDWCSIWGGSQFEEGFHNGINRVIGTLVGGLLVLPFYKLYTGQLFGIPGWVWLVAGVCLVLWCNFALGADSAIQPGIVIYFVVMFTVGKERVLLYTIARILDTGFGVLLTLLLYVLYPCELLGN